MSVPDNLTCPECGSQARLYTNMRWPCYKCPRGHDWRVGVDTNGVPLGTLANAELRSLRQQAHKSFDPLWQRGLMSRNAAYTWMANTLDLGIEEAHIACLDENQCRALIQSIRAYLTTDKLQDAWNNDRLER